VPHFTSQELLLLHCGIDGGGDVGRERAAGERRTGHLHRVPGERNGEDTRRQSEARRLVTCLSDGDDPGRDGMRVEFVSVPCVWAGRICQMPRQPPLPDLGLESHEAAAGNSQKKMKQQRLGWVWVCVCVCGPAATVRCDFVSPSCHQIQL